MSKGNPFIELVTQLNERDICTSDVSSGNTKSKTPKRKRSSGKARTTTSQDISPSPFNSTLGFGDTIFAKNPFEDHSYREQFMPRMRPGVPLIQNISMMSQGKMYPPNQSTIFNATNPNAPPIYPCGVCHKEVHDNDQAILCESGCNFWYHRICTGLTDTAYHMLTQEVYAEWVCDKCVTIKNIPLVKMKP